MGAGRRARHGLMALAGLLLATLLALAACSTMREDPSGQGHASVPEVVIVEESAPEPEPDPGPQPVTISLVMVGDILLHDHINECALQPDGTYDYSFLFAHVADEVSAADVAIVNQETPLGGADRGYYTRNVPLGEVPEDATDEEKAAIPVMPVFNSPDTVADAEVAAGFDVVLKAHNHTFDADYAGLAHELAYWSEHYPQVPVLGVADPYGESGTNYVENVYVYEKDGFRVAILNYSSGTNLYGGDIDWAVLSYIGEDKILSDVTKAREAGADMIVACPHWGIEYQLYPSDTQRYYAQFMADAGVDVIFGTHPHVIEPVEVLTGAGGNTCVCFYSNGNFITANNTAQNMVTGLSCATLQKDPDGACSIVAASFLPAVVHGGSGTTMTTYLLRDWSDELCASGWNGTLTRDWVNNHCASVLGDGFDPATGNYTVALPG